MRKPVDIKALEQLARGAHGGTTPPDVVGFLDKYLPFALSAAWAAFCAALYGLAVDVTALLGICGFSTPAPSGYTEALVVAGRRAGKSAVVAALGLFEAVVRGAEHMRFLAPGQRGYVVVISRTQRQALEVFRYARAIVEQNPELAALLAEDPLESQSGGELRFTNGVVLTVMPASKSSIRGFTILCAVLDEFAWVASDEDSADQDEEIAAAVRFAMLAPDGAPKRRIIIISSPAGKFGYVFGLYSKHHTDASAPVLVAHGPTWVWNPTITQQSLEVERKRDPKRYTREVLAEFVDAISPWCDSEYIDRCAEGRTAEPLPRTPGVRYIAGVDMAFRRDSAVLAIGHEVGDRFIVDMIERFTPSVGSPLDAPLVVSRFAETLRKYGCTWVLGDQFSIVPLAAEFKRNGIDLREETATNRSKLEHFGRLREAIYAGNVSLPAHEIALSELRQLQERVTGDGNVKIGAPNRATAHDDCAAAIAWCYAAVTANRPNETYLRGLAVLAKEWNADFRHRYGQ